VRRRIPGFAAHSLFYIGISGLMIRTKSRIGASLVGFHSLTLRLSALFCGSFWEDLLVAW
jgi:hypothetical protein